MGKIKVEQEDVVTWYRNWRLDSLMHNQPELYNKSSIDQGYINRKSSGNTLSSNVSLSIKEEDSKNKNSQIPFEVAVDKE